MPRTMDRDDDNEPSEDWHYDYEDTLPTTLCPNCQEEIPEDVAQCPYCGDHPSEEEKPASTIPGWAKLTAIVLLLLMLLSLG
jgi:predicted amidophosphoribosyltransferase